jgi:hypothetical protein
VILNSTVQANMILGSFPGRPRFKGNHHHRQFSHVIHIPSAARRADQLVVLGCARQRVARLDTSSRRSCRVTSQRCQPCPGRRLVRRVRVLETCPFLFNLLVLEKHTMAKKSVSISSEAFNLYTYSGQLHGIAERDSVLCGILVPGHQLSTKAILGL